MPFPLGASELLGMPIARDAGHAVIEGTRDQQRSHFRRGNVCAGYFGRHDVRSNKHDRITLVSENTIDVAKSQFDYSFGKPVAILFIL